VWASESDDGVSGVKIMTLSENLCTVTLGFGSDELNTTISISALNPVTLKGTDRWRCTTRDNYGTGCEINHPFELFTPEIVNASVRTTITSVGGDVEGNYHDITIGDPSSFFDFSDIGNILSSIGMFLLLGLIIVILCVIMYKIVKCVCAKRHTEDHSSTLNQSLDEEVTKFD
jgi:hypothetical protein